MVVLTHNFRHDGYVRDSKSEFVACVCLSLGAGGKDRRRYEVVSTLSVVWARCACVGYPGRSDLVARSQHMRAGDFKEFLDEAIGSSGSGGLGSGSSSS